MDKRFTDDELVAIRRAFRRGVSLNQLAREYNCDPNTLKRRLDPDWAQSYRDRRRFYGRGRKPEGVLRNVKLEPRVPEAHVRAFFQLMPPDTRDLTARIFGDPIPGRAAVMARWCDGQQVSA